MVNLNSQGGLVDVAKFLMKAGNDTAALTMATYARNSLATEILKSAVDAGGTSNPDWGYQLVPYRAASNSFLESLRSISVFDAMKPNMQRRPLGTRSVIFNATLGGGTVPEHGVIPVTSGNVGEVRLATRKASSILVVSNELLQADTADADSGISNEMKKGVSAATNRSFISEILSDAQSFESLDYSPETVVADIAKLAGIVCVSAQSRPYLIVNPATAVGLAFMTTTDGVFAFPDMTPSGGIISGIPVLVSDDLPDDSSGSIVAMIDAQAIAAGDAVVMMDTSRLASLQMDDAPVQSESELVSLFQTGSIALKVTRYFGFEIIRESGVAFLTGVDWSVHYD